MTFDLYPAPVYEGDLSPDNVGDDLEAICQEIHEACKGFGTDEDRLLNAMGALTPEQRCFVGAKYQELYDKDLPAVMRSEAGKRDFGTALQLLALPPHVMEAELLKRAGKGVGTNERVIHMILCGRTNKDMEILKKTFFEVFTQDLGQYMASELGGNLEGLIINCLQAAEQEYDPDFHTDEKMAKDVKALYEMGQGKWGTDEKGFFKLLCASPAEYLEKLNLAYADKYGYTLLKTMEKELGKGDSGSAGLFMLGMKLKPHLTIAKAIKAACKGFGTDEISLTSLLIRYQPVLKAVSEAYIEEYGETLQDVVKSECGGDYEKLLLKVIESASQN